MSYETELQQNNLDLQSLIEKANSLPSSSEVLAQANAYTDNPTVEELTGRLILTPGDNCEAAYVNSVYKTGNVINLSVLLRTSSEFYVDEDSSNEIMCYYEFHDSFGNPRPELYPCQSLVSSTFYESILMGTRLIGDCITIKVFGRIGDPGQLVEIPVNFCYICNGIV